MARTLTEYRPGRQRHRALSAIVEEMRRENLRAIEYAPDIILRIGPNKNLVLSCRGTNIAVNHNTGKHRFKSALNNVEVEIV